MPASTTPPPRPAAPKVADLSALARVMTKLDVPGPDPVQRKRQLLAAFCRLVAAQLDESVAGEGVGGAATVPPPAPNGHPAPAASAAPPASLSPRVAQTLERLLAGDSEKEVAARLGLSRHTVHVYVKAVYRHFDVCSRGELLAHFVRPAAPPSSHAQPCLAQPVG